MNVKAASPEVRAVNGVEGAVSAWDTGLEARMNASSVGLLAVRVATAAARSRAGVALNNRDVAAVQVVRDDLRGEAKVLRGEAPPNVADETAFAFAGVALNALSVAGAAKADGEEDAAARLDQVADDLDSLVTGGDIDQTQLASLENLFLTANVMMSTRLGQSGESVEGATGI